MQILLSINQFNNHHNKFKVNLQQKKLGSEVNLSKKAIELSSRLETTSTDQSTKGATLLQ